MATFTMVRRGFESVTFNFVSVTITDTESGVADTEDIYTLTIGKGKNAVSVKLDGKTGCEMVYHQYIAKGYKVVETPEPKVASPKKPKVEKPKVSREEALTAKYGDKEARKAYITAKNHFAKVVVATLTKWQNENRRLSLKEYADQRDKGIKQMLANWEAQGRPSLA